MPLLKSTRQNFYLPMVRGCVRIWSPSEGKELYRLDGFTGSISSLVLAKDTLITDGMENMVCLHDFSVDIDEAESGYELEW